MNKSKNYLITEQEVKENGVFLADITRLEIYKKRKQGRPMLAFFYELSTKNPEKYPYITPTGKFIRRKHSVTRFNASDNILPKDTHKLFVGRKLIGVVLPNGAGWYVALLDKERFELRERTQSKCV